MISELIKANPLLAGAVGMAAAGSAFAMLKSIPGHAWRWAKSRVMLIVEIENGGPSESVHRWMREWLSHNATSHFLMPCAFYREGVNGPQKPRITLCPKSVFSFRYRGRRIFAWEVEQDVQGSLAKRSTITLYLTGNDKKLIQSLILEAHDLAAGVDGSKVEIFVWDGYRWESNDKKMGRSVSSLCLDNGLGEQIISDARRFIESHKWYRSLGIPWRRGYLFYGPPGNGKSSLAHVIATECSMGISILNVGSFADDAMLIQAVSKIPSSQIILVEDVDAMWDERKSIAGKGVSFSGFLNAIDGAAAKDGRIVIMTTNHVDRLDPALIRPGRADVKIELGNATESQAINMLLRFFPSSTEAEQNLFSLRWRGHSLASIQNELLGRVTPSPLESEAREQAVA